MEYGNLLETVKNTVIDTDKEYDEHIDPSKYIGWSTITEWNELPRQLFTKYTLKVIQKKVYQYLLEAMDKKIVPSERIVIIALYGVFENHIPRTGDIYGKYLVVDQTQRDDYGYIVDKTISLLIDGIKNDIEMTEANNKLTIWTTVLGDLMNMDYVNFLL